MPEPTPSEPTPPAVRDRRWPRRVYGTGREPDARFSLANERTFLAWIRTSLALLGAGVALEALQVPVQPGFRLAASAVLLA
ncbi:YidH family protein, partial [Kineococcus glutinatus]|uniref:YidH family protein n=1 Tax=Kineococcus glutinatus TaxID=1070872 RepID=UPI0031EB912E